MARSGRFPHLHTSPFFLMASMRWSISMAIFQKIAILEIRVPGQFAMCENLPRHRFQFNSQISIYFDIQQWFLSDIRKINIVLSVSMQIVKKITRENVERDTINNC